MQNDNLSHYVLVLGRELSAGGLSIGERLQSRINTAYELYRSLIDKNHNRVKFLLYAGTDRKVFPKQEKHMGALMEEYLKNCKNVPVSDMEVLPESENLFGTRQEVARALTSHGRENATLHLVSHSYHMPRLKLILALRLRKIARAERQLIKLIFEFHPVRGDSSIKDDIFEVLKYPLEYIRNLDYVEKYLREIFSCLRKVFFGGRSP